MAKERFLPVTSSKDYNYLLYLPKDESKTLLTLLVFLHGAGEKGDNLNLVKKQGIPKLIEEGFDFPCVVVAPQCPKFSYWNPDSLKKLIDHILTEHSIDKKRIYLTGISMGGYGTWALAIKHPELFAAIIPICGGGDHSDVHKIKSVPTWVFHGELDSIVPLSESEIMVDTLLKAGGNVKFTIYPDAEHDSWTRTYNNPEVFKWLFEQKLK